MAEFKDLVGVTLASITRMSWSLHHSRSEQLAAEADLLTRNGERYRAADLYKEAAAEEFLAFKAIEATKQRTRGITAVSAVALSYKGTDFSHAESIAYQCLSSGEMPPFAEAELRNLLQMIWTSSSAEKQGIRFVPGDVMVSVKGGQVIHGGDPLALMGRVGKDPEIKATQSGAIIANPCRYCLHESDSPRICERCGAAGQVHHG